MGRMSRFRALAGLLIILWVVEFVNLLLAYRLNSFGLVPRSVAGLPGIALAPLLHGSIAHIVSNSGGLAVLGGLVALRGERHFVGVTVGIALLSGILVWLLGRPAVHIGASGLVFGYFGLLLARAWHDRSPGAIAIGATALILYGGMLWGLSPLQRYVSWEAHLAGLLAGIALARLTPDPGRSASRPKP